MNRANDVDDPTATLNERATRLPQVHPEGDNLACTMRCPELGGRQLVENLAIEYFL